jgi:hypothetical protein
MRGSWLVGTLASACVLTTQAAQADWQYTKWGMNPAQVIRSAPPQAALRAPTPPEASALAIKGKAPSVVGYHYAGNLAFNVALYFSDANNGLSIVQLDMRNAKWPDILASLVDQYGPPLTGGGSPRLLWRDRMRGNAIEALNMDLISRVIINYTPLSATGL